MTAVFQIVDNKQMMGASLKEANFSLAGVYYAAGDDIKYQVLQNVGPVASSKVRPYPPRKPQAAACVAAKVPLA